MFDHYKTLGISPAATSEEIRRAFRTLARRYHPDVNPGKGSTEKFRQISEAYQVLSDSDTRRLYDQERTLHDTFSSAFDRAHAAYRRQQNTHGERSREPQKPKAEKHEQPDATVTGNPGVDSTTRTIKEPKQPAVVSLIQTSFKSGLSRAREALRRIRSDKTTTDPLHSLSIVEIPVSVFEAITGAKKTVEISEFNSTGRAVAVTIPSGVRQGSVIRLRGRSSQKDEIIGIIRIAHHPWISVSHRGLTIEVPITICEATCGARINVPSLEESLLLTIHPCTQSGSEVRIKNKGIHLPDGTRGDLYVRFMIKVPPAPLSDATTAACQKIGEVYPDSVRHGLPKSIMEAAQTL